MRGQFSDQGRMFSYLSPEERVPKGHPLRAVRAMVRTVLEELHGDFARLYSSDGRPSIPPEQLLSARFNDGGRCGNAGRAASDARIQSRFLI